MNAFSLCLALALSAAPAKSKPATKAAATSAPRPTQATPAGAELNGYQQVTWGMSREQVLKVMPDLQETILSPLKVEVIGTKGTALPAYTKAGTLKAVRIKLDASVAHPDIATSDFDQIAKALDEKYGVGTDLNQGRDPKLAGDRGAQGRALLDGKLHLARTWDLPKTEIFLHCSGTSSLVDFTLSYQSKEPGETQTPPAKNDQGI